METKLINEYQEKAENLFGFEPNELYSQSLGYGYENNRFCHLKDGLPTIEDFCFVHGDETELKEGKVCVIREQFIYIKKLPTTHVVVYNNKSLSKVEEDYMDKNLWKIFDDEDKNKPTYKTLPFKEGKLLVLGKTVNGNSKVKLFSK